MFEFKHIYKAYKKCLKHKKHTKNALKFEQDLVQNICSLEDELKMQTYKIGRSICFLASSPKLREIFAADFRDRVVHHLLVDQLELYYEKKFIYDVYNNRKNKGIHKAVKRAKKFMNRVGHKGYYLQLDIKGFFYNIDKNILFKQIFRDISQSDLKYKDSILYLSNKIIYHDPTKEYIFKGNKATLQNLPSHKTLFKIPKHKGIPIGNLTSQFFANIYLNKFDHFVKRDLKVKYYIRYVDDFVIFDESVERLREVYIKIKQYLYENLHLELRKDVKMQAFKEGLDFLGYIVRPKYTLVRQRVVNNFKYNKALFLDEYENSQAKMDLAKIEIFLSQKASFKGHCSHANSYKLLDKVWHIDDQKYIDLITTKWSTT